MAFNAVNKAPGVYIDEIQLPGPIAGVGTSTAAFIGPAEKGKVNKPKFLTSPAQFESAFGGYIMDPTTYVTHAVHAFFANGGTSCYFVRVGTGVRSTMNLIDQRARATLIVEARQEGVAGDAITVEVRAAQIAAALAKTEQIPLVEAGPGSTIAANQAKATSAANAKLFFPGDVVLITEGAGTDRVAITRISGDLLTLDRPLSRAYTGAATLELADLAAGQRRIRLDAVTDIEPGTYLSIADGANSEGAVVRSVEPASSSVTLERGLKNAYGLAGPVNVRTQEFTLVITTPPVVETYTNLSMDPRHSRYFGRIVDSASVEVRAPDEPNPSVPPDNLPDVAAVAPLAGGVDEDITQITSVNYQRAIGELEKIDDVNLLCVPDSVGRELAPPGAGPDPVFAQDVQQAMIDHCERMQERFAVLDPLPKAEPSNGILTQRNLLVSSRGFGALYYPWVYVKNPVASGRLLVPPSGHIAGAYALTDEQRGVHKAPANVTLRGVLGLERLLSDAEQGPLNEKGINVIRSFPGRGIRVWGARTIAPSDITQWRYVNVRRLLLFIEESIQEGTAFAVFEPNELGLWKKLERQVTDFLTRVWQDGALFGATPEDAFRVRIDEELNPPSLRALGQLVVEVVVVPTTPAEFVVFRIISDPTGSVLEES